MNKIRIIMFYLLKTQIQLAAFLVWIAFFGVVDVSISCDDVSTEIRLACHDEIIIELPSIWPK